MICPVCKQEVGDTGLGTPLPHHFQGSQEFCPGFVGEVPQYIAPGVMPVPEDFAPPGRKVRSDKGTKRGQRKTVGPEAAPGGPAEPGLTNELATPDDVRPPTLVQDWVSTSAPGSMPLESTGTANLPIDEYEGKRTPREGYYAAAPDWLPLIRTFEEARDLAARYCAQGEPSYVFHVIPIRKLESGIKETRLGRVRKAKS